MNRAMILETAAKIVTGNREQEYGSPEDNFKQIANLWNSFLETRQGKLLTAADVAIMMILFKIGRLATGAGSVDTWLDIAGYAACGGEIGTAEAPELQFEPMTATKGKGKKNGKRNTI